MRTVLAPCLVLLHLVYPITAQVRVVQVFNPANPKPALPGHTGLIVNPNNIIPASAYRNPTVRPPQNPRRLPIIPPPRFAITRRPPFFPPRPVRTPPPRLRPTRRPPISRSRAEPSWETILRDAQGKVDAEDRDMQRRLDAGVDKYPRDFTNPDPLLFSESPENAEAFSRPSRIINWVARILKQNHPGYRLSQALSHPSAARYSATCPFIPPQSCDPFAKYRSVDGSCNNLNNPLWGSAFIPFVRYLPAEYITKGIRDDFPKSKSVRDSTLPNPRVISTRFHQPAQPRDDDSIFPMMLTIFGQFLAHDITDRAPTKGANQAVLKCCNQFIETPDGKCANVEVPRRDVFRQFDRSCMEFPRSLEVTDLECTEGTREQLNQASSFIDGGAIYGATKNRSDTLRRFKGGLLMTSFPKQLPIIPHGNSQATMQGLAFYAAGDNRVNEFIGLIAMETLWMREHNRIAEDLADLNPHWNDEKLFQETRRIIIALIQHITYAEYLPAILGEGLMLKYDLSLLLSGHYSHYDNTMNPGLSNGFAGAAMRFGHSMLRTTFSLLNRDRDSNGYRPLDLKESFFRPQTFLLHEDPLMQGMASEPSKMCDRVISGSAINNLYETEKGTGSDLAANNIQRGRDHGLPNYFTWRQHYGLPVPRRFDNSRQGFPDHSADTVRRLKMIYSDVEHVDLFVGGISETPVKDGAVGQLFGNIIGQQFKSLKKGDRFWYETSEQPQAFTLGQLREIRKVTMARLLCNTYSIDSIQPRAFFNTHPTENSLVSCSTIPEVNLAPWRE